MAEFLTTHGTTARIEQIIAKARERIVVISPYLQWSRILYERLVEADRLGVPIVLVYGKRELDYDQQELLEQLDNLSLYYCENLHAKCYFNEQQLVISSLNLYEYSERNNREMGVVFSRTEGVYRDAVTEAQSIVEASVLEFGEPVTLIESPTVRHRAPAARQLERRPSNRGYCIRCGESIPLDRERPLCAEHEKIWAVWANWDYEEQYCHQCRAQAPTTKGRPLCDQCFRGGF